MSFPAYNEYRESGVEWIGPVPTSWSVAPLRRTVTLVTEKASSRSAPMALENIESWTGKFIDTESTYEGDGVLFASGDILFGKLRPYLAKAWLATHPGEAVGDFHVLRCTSSSSPEFIHQTLLSRDVISQIDGSTHGAKMPRVSWEFMASLPLPIPSPHEQHAISTFLNRETAKIDDLIAEQKRLVALLEEKRQAVISHVTTKGLDPGVQMKESGIEWLGAIPEHWQIRPFSSVIDFQEGPGIMAADFREQGVPLLRVSGMHGNWASLEGCNHLDPEKVTRRWDHFRLQRGDLVLSASASMGMVCEVGEEVAGAIAYTGLIRLTAKKGQTTREYIRAIIRSSVFSIQVDQLKAGAIIQHFGPTHLRKMIVVKPPIHEQVEITSYLSKETSKCDSLIEEVHSAISLLKERRAALVSAAVTGKIDVRGLAAANLPIQAAAA